MKCTIISGTNRKGSNTYKISLQYQRMLKERGVDATVWGLEDVNPLSKPDEFLNREATLLKPAEKYVFVSPEYNGSIPGILKLVIDEADWKTAWRNKKAMLVGVSTGRAGNLRGMDHLASILHHMHMHVLPNMLPISQVDKYLDEKGEISDAGTLSAMQKQVDQFIHF
ncbi:MAG TPA: NAD(P)H-dependent oxidoreductase [Chitinophagaceae bacterium]|jgi:NAD(P)H-dependent FMN reductase|nr:NAD(P)H-dependent oxidoreductase [Chitinophagaceae bacterium]